MTYEEVIDYYLLKWKRREAWFVKKYYIENKSRQIIIDELYLNCDSIYYKLKSRIREFIKDRTIYSK